MLYNTAVYNTAVYNTAVYNTAVYNAAVYNAAVYNTAVYNAAVYNAAVYNAAVYNADVYNAAVYNAGVFVPMFLVELLPSVLWGLSSRNAVGKQHKEQSTTTNCELGHVIVVAFTYQFNCFGHFKPTLRSCPNYCRLMKTLYNILELTPHSIFHTLTFSSLRTSLRTSLPTSLSTPLSYSPSSLPPSHSLTFLPPSLLPSSNSLWKLNAGL